MDTHVTTSPVFDDSATLRARLPGEPEDAVSGGGDLPPLHAEKRETPLPPARKRRSSLLSGVAIIALAVIASGAFLLSPYNTIVPVPPALKLAASHAEMRVAALLSHPMAPPARAPSADQVKTAAAASLPGTSVPASPVLADSTPNVVAPAAALAPIHTPPPASVVQPPYKPAPPHTQMAELLDLQQGAAAPGPQDIQPKSVSAAPKVLPPSPKMATVGAESGTQTIPGQSAQSGPQVPASSPPHQPVTAQAEIPPPGYVAREPGAAPDPASQRPQTPAKTVDNGHTGSEPARGETPQQTAAAHLSVPSQADASVSHVQPLQDVSVGPSNALAISPKLEAAPMAAPQQIQVLELVTQLATLIRDQRTEIANLQADVRTGQKATAAKLGDFERRLALVEAGSALAAASNTAAPATATAAVASPAPTTTTVALTSAKAALAAASAPQAAAPSAPVPTTTQANAAAPEQYRVQAASPGLAMLAALDRSGGDGAQQAVQPGDTLPGYGRVLSVAQQGTAWVVRTEHGTIQ